MAKLNAWGSIESLANVRRNQKKFRRGLAEKYQEPGNITWRAKVTLPGPPAGILVRDDGIHVQSRSQVCDGQNTKHFGMHSWLQDRKELFNNVPLGTTFYGEWCGPGIQKGVAISLIPRKIFAVFAIQLSSGELVTNPIAIAGFTPQDPDIFILPYYGDPIEFNLSDLESVSQAADKIGKMVTTVEECDPFVESNFGIKGTGEGLVFSVLNGPSWIFESREIYSYFTFKAKGDKHKVVREGTKVPVDPQKIASVEAFTYKFCTPQRMEQGLQEVRGEAEISRQLTGKFIGWFSQDVKKESATEIEESELTWRDVHPSVSREAKNWFLKKCTESES